MTRRRWHQVTARLSDRGMFRIQVSVLPPTQPSPTEGRRAHSYLLPPCGGGRVGGRSRLGCAELPWPGVSPSSLSLTSATPLSRRARRTARPASASRRRSPPRPRHTSRTQDGFRLDLLAAEPLVTDPVAVAYDEDGRAYVVEMRDYPYTDRIERQAVRRAHDRPAARPRPAPRRHRRRRPVRPEHDLRRRALVADRPRALEGRRLRRRDARHLVPQGHRRRRPGRRAPEGLHRLPQVQRPGRDEQPAAGASTTGSTARAARNGGADPPRRATAAGRRCTMAARDFRFDPATGVRGDLGRGAVRPTRSTTGATASSATSATRSGTSSCRGRYLARNPLPAGRLAARTTSPRRATRCRSSGSARPSPGA